MSKTYRSCRNLPFSVPRNRGLLLLALVLAVLPGLPLAAQEGGGLDYLHTTPKGTSFKFVDEFSIPAGFFGTGSERFTGTILFNGVPLGTFRGQKTGNADTIVERKTPPALHSPYPSEGRTEIELVALSLQSTQPIKVRVGKKFELWEVRAQPSPNHPSTGTMTIQQRNKQGGTASSELTVYPLFTFTRRGDKAERTLDTGALKLSSNAPDRLTLRVKNMPWSTQGPSRMVAAASSNSFFASVKAGIPVSTMHASAVGFHSVDSAAF